jgi:hypothetical protein
MSIINKLFNQLKEFHFSQDPPLLERGLAVFSLYFPFIEACSYFGPKFYLNTTNIAIRKFYALHVIKWSTFYSEHNLLIFVFMIWVFIQCSRGAFPLTLYGRFTIIQGILLSIAVSCFGVTYTFLPPVFRESSPGNLIAIASYIGVIITIIYSVIVIIYGRYPKIPVISEGAKLQVQRGSGG